MYVSNCKIHILILSSNRWFKCLNDFKMFKVNKLMSIWIRVSDYWKDFPISVKGSYWKVLLSFWLHLLFYWRHWLARCCCHMGRPDCAAQNMCKSLSNHGQVPVATQLPATPSPSFAAAAVDCVVAHSNNLTWDALEESKVRNISH